MVLGACDLDIGVEGNSKRVMAHGERGREYFKRYSKTDLTISNSTASIRGRVGKRISVVTHHVILNFGLFIRVIFQKNHNPDAVDIRHVDCSKNKNFLIYSSLTLAL